MDETSKSAARRKTEGWDRFTAGHGIDIGCGSDPITADCDRWDRDRGDGQQLAGVQNELYDWVYSSHFLEHTRDPLEALLNQWRILKPGGYLLIAVPHEDLYEQGVWPSAFNCEHIWTFCLSKTRSWSPVSRSLSEMIKLLPGHELISLKTCDADYDYNLHGAFVSGGAAVVDQTQQGAEAMIEAVVRKVSRPIARRSLREQVITCPECSGRMYIESIDQGALHLLCAACGAPAIANTR